CRRGSRDRARAPGDADAVYAARDEGRRRVWRGRAPGRTLQRDRERAARARAAADGAAADAEPGLGRDPGCPEGGERRMISQELDFYAPTTLSEALDVLAANAEDGKPLAGGMSLVPAMNLGIARPTAVVSLNRLPELDYVREDGDVVRIGAMTRHARI